MKLFLIFFLFLTACSHQPFSNYQKEYAQVRQKLSINTEFGFVLNSNSYDFTRVITQEADIACDYFYGYKNGQLAYQFSTFEDKSLIEIFQKKTHLNIKSREILQHIEKVNVLGKGHHFFQKTSCKNMYDYKIDSMSYAIIFSPAILLVMPIALPVAIQDEVNQKNIFAKIKSVSLNRTQTEVQAKLGSPNRVSDKQGYKILSYSWSAQPPVFANYFFEEGKMVGYVVGYDSRPQTVIEQAK